MKPIYITSIEAWDIKCFDHFSAKLGMVTVVTGTNGSGKSSFTKLIDMFFAPGGDPSLIRHGCEEGRAIVTFSNGYSACKVQKRDSYELKVMNPEGGVCPAPATILQKLLPRHSFNPEQFLTFDLKKRTEFILANLPVSFRISDINTCLSTKIGKLAVREIQPLPDGPDKSLDEFDAFYDEVESARAVINRQVENLKGANRTLEQSLPQDDDVDWSRESGRIQAELGAVETEIATSEADVRLEAELERTKQSKALGAEIKAAKESVATYVTAGQRLSDMIRGASVAAELSASLCADLKACGAIDIDDFIKSAKDTRRLESELSAIIQKIDGAEAAAISQVRQEKGEVRTKLAGELGEAKQKSAQQERGKGVKLALDKARAELKGEVVRYEQLTAVLDALKRLKAEQLRAVDIDGFDIRWEKTKGARTESAVILIDGIPLDSLNTQAALFVALKLVLLAQKANQSEEQLRLVVMETAELVESNRRDLQAAVERAKLQLVVTVPVDGQALAVQSV